MGACTTTHFEDNEHNDLPQSTTTMNTSIITAYKYPSDEDTSVTQTIELLDRIGEGQSGDVFSCMYNNKRCAVKRTSKIDRCGSMTFITETKSLSKMNHPSIITYIDALVDDEYYYLIVQLADFSLYDVIAQKSALSESDIQPIILSLLEAVAYMHKKKVVHRDIKPDNIVFMKQSGENKLSQPILIDFGDAELAKNGKLYSEFVGTPPYLSPERLAEHNAEELLKSDIWAIGCIAFELFTGRRCFDGDTQKIVFGKILNGEWLWPNKPSKDMQDFVVQCLEMDVNERLSAKDALLHSWFADA